MTPTAKQRAWLAYHKQGYTPAEAARLAGYKAKSDSGFASIGYANMQKLEGQGETSPRAADVEAIHTFWMRLVLDDEADLKDRLKASELYARAAGLFTDKGNPAGAAPVVIYGADGIRD